jgi:hypothetical protein
MSRKSHSLFTSRNSSHSSKPSSHYPYGYSHLASSIPLITLPTSDKHTLVRSCTSLPKNTCKQPYSYSPSIFNSLSSTRIYSDKLQSHRTTIAENIVEQSHYEVYELKEVLRSRLQEVFQNFIDAFYTIAGDRKGTCNFFQMKSLLNELYLPADEQTIKSLVQSISTTQSITFQQFKAFWFNKTNVCSVSECSAETEPNQYLCEVHSRGIRERGKKLIEEIMQELDPRLYKKFQVSISFIKSRLGYGLVMDDVKKIMRHFINTQRLSNIDWIGMVEYLRFHRGDSEDKHELMANELIISKSNLNSNRRLKAFCTTR